MDANRHKHREKINRSPEMLRGEIYADTGTVERCLACEAERSEQIFNSPAFAKPTARQAAKTCRAVGLAKAEGTKSAKK
jgi:hypothetical protein